MPIRAVLFDLGDTLWHFPNFPDDATAIAASARRIEDCLRAWDLCDGVACASLAAAIRTAQWQHTLDAEHSHGRSPDFAALAGTCAAELGLTLTDEQSAALWDAWNLGGAFYGRTVFPDTIPTLDELQRRGYRLGVVTNRALGGPRFRDELRDAGLLDRFETIAVSCDDGWLKPHPALFQRALADLGLPPEEVVMVGDNLRADVMGAKALGMTAVWKRPPDAEQDPAPLPDGTLALPDYTIDHPAELLTLPILADTTRHRVRPATTIKRDVYPGRMVPSVRAILFDLDDTLWHFPVRVPDDVLHTRCAEQIGPLLAAWGVACDPADLSRRVLNAIERTRQEAVAGSLLSPDWSGALDAMLRSTGISLDPDQLDALWAAWQVDGARLGRQLYPDTVTTLAWARQQGYRVGLITNRWSGAAMLQRELDGCNLGRAFDCIACSSDVGWLKPHPEIFSAALRGLGTEPDETVMVGNSLRTDIAGAKMLGMRAVWKRNGRRQVQADPVIAPDAMIDDLWEIRRLPFLSGDAKPFVGPPAPER